MSLAVSNKIIKFQKMYKKSDITSNLVFENISEIEGKEDIFKVKWFFENIEDIYTKEQKLLFIENFIKENEHMKDHILFLLYYMFNPFIKLPLNRKEFASKISYNGMNGEIQLFSFVDFLKEIVNNQLTLSEIEEKALYLINSSHQMYSEFFRLIFLKGVDNFYEKANNKIKYIKNNDIKEIYNITYKDICKLIPEFDYYSFFNKTNKFTKKDYKRTTIRGNYSLLKAYRNSWTKCIYINNNLYQLNGTQINYKNKEKQLELLQLKSDLMALSQNSSEFVAYCYLDKKSLDIYIDDIVYFSFYKKVNTKNLLQSTLDLRVKMNMRKKQLIEMDKVHAVPSINFIVYPDEKNKFNSSDLIEEINEFIMNNKDYDYYLLVNDNKKFDLNDLLKKLEEN